jgi:hypothetical protein
MSDIVDVISYNDPFIEWNSDSLEISTNSIEKTVVNFDSIKTVEYEPNILEITAGNMILQLIFSEDAKAAFYAQYLNYIISSISEE